MGLSTKFQTKKIFSLAEAAEHAEKKRIQDTGIRKQEAGVRIQE